MGPGAAAEVELVIQIRRPLGDRECLAVLLFASVIEGPEHVGKNVVL